ncbi:MAG TPA: STAS domain-containing protein [Gallionellaceae bacterium]|nr:STAS domain-containing protein [Gallionellaceae bacterium]
MSDDDAVRLTGPLTLNTVKSLFERGLPEGRSSLVVDLSAVEAVDSAAVSLLLSWLREAQRRNITLCFNSIPENLMSLARLYGVADLLPMCGAAAA